METGKDSVNKVGWSAGCAETRLSGAGSAREKPTVRKVVRRSRSTPCLLIVLTILGALLGCGPVRMYTESVQQAFSPQNKARVQQQHKEQLCGKSAC